MQAATVKFTIHFLMHNNYIRFRIQNNSGQKYHPPIISVNKNTFDLSF